MLHVTACALEPWTPEDPLFRGRTAWRAGDGYVCDGVEQIVLAGARADFGCETCLTFDCGDRRRAWVGRLGADVLFTPRGDRVPGVLERHGALLVAGVVWETLTTRFPNLAAPIPPATRAMALEAWLSALPWPKWGYPPPEGARAAWIRAGNRLEYPAIDDYVERALRWAAEAPDAPVEVLADPEPDTVYFADGEWTGAAWGADDERGWWFGGWGVR